MANEKNFEHEAQEPCEGILLETLDPDMIPVPLERYKELIKKEVELDLIYARRRADKSYNFDSFIDALIALRFGEDAEEGE